MERLTLTQTQQDAVASWLATKANDTLNPVSPDVPGTNLVPDDHLEIDGSWYIVVFGGSNGGVCSYVPAWELFFDCFVCQDYVTDRAGPNGETMPIFNPPVQARGAAAPAVAPSSTPAPHKHRRDIKEALRDAIKRMPHDQQKHAREVLRTKGVLGKDD